MNRIGVARKPDGELGNVGAGAANLARQLELEEQGRVLGLVGQEIVSDMNHVALDDERWPFCCLAQGSISPSPAAVAPLVGHDQSSSASRATAGASGFLVLSQYALRPEL